MSTIQASPTDEQLFALAVRTGSALKKAGIRVATAESCTGGWVAKALTDVAGSSVWFECGYVTYSNDSKVRDIGVSPRVLIKHGAVSEMTARGMALGTLRVTTADVAVAITGVAGPEGGSKEKPVGTVWFGLAVRSRRLGPVIAERKRFDGTREDVRRKSVQHALRLIMRAAKRSARQT